MNIKIYTVIFCMLVLVTFSGCNSNNASNNSSDLNTSIQNNSSDIVSLQEDVTSNESSTITDSSSKESLPQSSNENSNNDEINKPIVNTGEYTVIFDYGYENKKVTAKSQSYKISKPEEPIRQGYKFWGWYATNETEQWNFTGHAVTNDMTLKAKWGKYRYYITYSNFVDGKETIILKKTDFNSAASRTESTSSEPEKGKAVIFEKYSVAIKDATGFIDGSRAESSISLSSDEYDKFTFRVPNCFSVDSESFTIPELSVAGYTFLGWTYEGQTTPVKTVTIPKGTTKDYKLVANWKS